MCSGLLSSDGEIDADVTHPPCRVGGRGAADVGTEQRSDSGGQVGEDGLGVAGGADDSDVEDRRGFHGGHVLLLSALARVCWWRGGRWCYGWRGSEQQSRSRCALRGW